MDDGPNFLIRLAANGRSGNDRKDCEEEYVTVRFVTLDTYCDHRIFMIFIP
jgi:hypothetical protein